MPMSQLHSQSVFIVNISPLKALQVQYVEFSILNQMATEKNNSSDSLTWTEGWFYLQMET